MRRIFAQICKSIEPIDIREAIGFKEDNKNEIITEGHYLITSVDILKEKATSLGYDFCTKNGFIYVFNGQYWQQIPDGLMGELLRDIANKIGIDRYRADYYKFTEALLKQFFASAATLQENYTGKTVINLQNGTYEFGAGGKLREFKKEDYLTYQVPFEYNPQTEAPIFERYLNRVLPDKESQNILAEFLGYVFTKGNKEEKCLLLKGSGANGKSVLFAIVRALYGAENVTSYSLKDLNHENCRALICNKLLNYSSEIIEY